MRTKSIVAALCATLLGAIPLFAQGNRGQASDAVSSADVLAQEHARKAEIAEAVLSAREAASRKMSPRLRGELTARLTSAPLDRLEAFATAGGLGDIESLVRETVGPKTLGDTGADLIFTPVTPCRIINTTVAGGVINANTTRSFFVNGNTAGTFETQGGTAGGCGIPDDATSVEMNFIAVGPAGPGDFRAFPFSASPTAPLASIINYANVSGLNIANGIAQPVCNAATTTCTFDLIVQADVSAAYLVVDVVGYYRKADKVQVAAVKSSGFTKSSLTVPAVGQTSIQTLTVTFPTAGFAVITPQSSWRSGQAAGQWLDCRLLEDGVQVAAWYWDPGDFDGWFDIWQTHSTTKAVTAGAKTYNATCRVDSGVDALAYDREIHVMFFGAALP